MVKLYETGAYLLNGSELVPDDGQAPVSYTHLTLPTKA